MSRPRVQRSRGSTAHRLAPGDHRRGPGSVPHAGSTTIEELFALYRDRGDVEAIAEVYDRTALRLLSVASHLCTEPADAEDAVQATFLAALEAAESWQPDRPLMPWLLGILTNRVLRQRRTALRRPDGDRLPEPAIPGPSDAAQNAEFDLAVDEAIAGMPSLYQSVLVLRIKHGMAPADIAHALRRPPATVRAQLSRGLEMLRKSLPPIFAAGILTAALPARGSAAVKAAVLAEAVRLAPPPQWTSWLTAKPASAAAAALLIAALAFALLRPGTSRAAPTGIETKTLGAGPPGEPVDVPAMVIQRAADPTPRTELQRLDVGQASGPELVVAVRDPSGPVAGAAVDVEFLGDAPDAWVTSMHDRWGSRAILRPTHASTVPERRGMTGPDGTVRFAELERGFWLVHTPARSGVLRIVDAASTSVVVDTKVALRRIEGLVADERGAPIGGAEIWATTGPDDTSVHPRGTADALGRFSLATSPGSRLLARAPGRIPAGIRILENTAGPIDLVLLPGGASVRGRIVGRDRMPIVGATVQVGALAEGAPAGGDTQHTPPSALETDADGRFELHGVAPGTVQLELRAQGHVPRTIEIIAACDDGDAPLPAVEFELAVGGRVQGVVYDATGRPAAGAAVRILGDHGPPATTHSDGSFRLVGVRAGRRTLVVGSTKLGWGLGEVLVAEDAETHWNGHLTWDRLTIEGRVEGAATGGPLVVVADNGDRRTVASVDPATASFRIEVPEFGLDRLAHVMLLRAGDVDAEGRPTRPSLDAIADVQVGTAHITLRTDRFGPATGGLRGRWTTLADVPPPDHVWIGRDAAGDRALVPLERESGAAGGFRIGALPAGRYWLHLQTERIGPFQVREGIETDIGDVAAPGDRQGDRQGAPHHTLAFAPPAEEAFARLLEVEVHDARGRRVARHALPFRRGGWQLPLWLEDGEYRATPILGSERLPAVPFRVQRDPTPAYPQRIALTR